MSRPDYWSTQREKERGIVSLISVCKNATDYVPDHTTQKDQYMLQCTITVSLTEDLAGASRKEGLLPMRGFSVPKSDSRAPTASPAMQTW